MFKESQRKIRNVADLSSADQDANLRLDISASRPARHFRLLRTARMRGLKVRRLGERVYAVSSYSNPNQWHQVTDSVCSCAALKYCTHAAIAFDAWIADDADTSTYLHYNLARREDLANLQIRIFKGETSAEDRRYVAWCVAQLEAKREPEAVAGRCAA